jgi:hypothetical protein
MSIEHPEALLDRARSGQIAAADLAALEAHAAGCAACRFELRLIEDGRRAGKPRVSDELLMARIRRATTRRLVARGLSARAPSAVRRRRVAWLVAAAVLGVAIATGATLKPRAPSSRLQHAAEPARRLSLAAWSGHVGRGVAAPSPASNAAPETPAIAPRARVETRASSASQPATAAELFSEANRARRAGNVSAAVGLYKHLQGTFPGSTEAHVSRVSLGRVFLDRAGSPAAALAQFDGYLASGSQGALRHEALIGRALALQRMGRAREELAAWRSVLAAYPRTSHAPHARARIEELTQHAAKRVSPR